MLGPVMSALPRLRDDLELLPGPRVRGGAPSWTVYDPVRNRYFRISQAAFELLSRWHLGDWRRIAKAVARATGRSPGEGERDWMVRFLNANMLIQRSGAADVADLEKIGRAGKSNWLTWLLHQYLFIRIPLVRPQRLLDATLPFALLAMSKTMMVLILLIALAGGYLVLAQWDTFLATFLHFSSLDGMLWYGLALVFAKIFHELGHAYTAARYGCRVPSMGVAFLVMWPVLYTDTSDAWRLTDKRQRLAIGAAGMIAELVLAVLATFLWSFLPDGPARSAAFIIATVTWIMTLAVNLNPFMRFDGYYLLSDALEVENLQDRAFAYTRWWLRERLFGFGEAAPEAFPKPLARALIAYACATWVYRFFLFLGIAVLVYAFFFKLLGIFLFVVELVWFIGLPVAREAAEWWKRRDALRLNRNLGVTLSLTAVGLLLLVVPWRTTVQVAAVLQAEERAQIYAPLAARVQALHVQLGDTVAKGDVLLILEAPDLEHQIAQAQRSIGLIRIQVRREAAGGSESENIRVLQRRLAGEVTALRGLMAQQVLLTVRAPIAGQVAYIDYGLTAGLWINDSRPLIQVVADGAARLDGYIDERNVAAIGVDAPAVFYPDDPSQPSLTARVTEVADINSPVLDVPYLASVHGGGISVETGNAGTLLPTRGIYRVSLAPQPAVDAPGSVQRGVVHIKGEPESLLVRVWKQAWSVVLRESGF